MMKSYDILENPRGETYKTLIQILCHHSDYFYFVTRKELTYDKDVLQKFLPFVLKTYKTNEWESTITKGPAATIYEVEINPQTIQLLTDCAESLYEWISPQLPEDLTFVKNKYAWFYSCSHEKFAVLRARNPYYQQLIEKIDGMTIERVED